MKGITSVAKKSIQWQLMKPRVVVNEGIQAALVMFTLAMGFMKLPMLLGLWMLELVIMTALSASFYPQRGRRRAIMDVLKMIALCAFLGIFPLVMYFGAAKASMKFEPSSIVSAVAMLVLRIAMIARTARAATDPALAWANAALTRGAVVVIGLFLGVFACFLPGMLIVGALRYVAPNVAPDVGMGLVLLVIQIGLVAVLSTMTEAELREIAGNPYID